MNLSPEKLKKLSVSPETTIKVAMQTLNVTASKIIFVINDKNKLIGSITDGDIRRAILSGIGFERPISKTMHKFPRSVKRLEKAYREKAERYMVEEELYAIPVLDDSDKIVDIFFWQDFLEKHPLEFHAVREISNPVVIMAGGKGERLDPFTKILQKPFIPFGDKPIIEKIITNFSKYGFSNFILTLNYKKDLIKAYFKEYKSLIISRGWKKINF